MNLGSVRGGPTKVTQALRYLLAGGLAFLVDTGCYALLLALGSHYAAAATAGFCAGLMVAYALSVRWVFVHRGIAERRVEFFLFFGTGVLGWLQTLALLWAMIDHAGVPALPARVVTAALVLVSNYSLRRRLIFFARPQPERAARGLHG